MFFNRNNMPKIKYMRFSFLIIYFIVGIFVLLSAFVFYTSRIVKRLDEAQRKQVPALADLASVIPSIKDIELGERLERDFNLLLENSRLSFIITDIIDNKEQIIKVRGIDTKIDTKIDREPFSALTEREKQKLTDALNKMKKKAGNKFTTIEYVEEDRILIGYFYYGNVNPNKIGVLPFVITDLNNNPVAVSYTHLTLPTN